jgi:hypothetical protein
MKIPINGVRLLQRGGKRTKSGSDKYTTGALDKKRPGYCARPSQRNLHTAFHLSRAKPPEFIIPKNDKEKISKYSPSVRAHSQSRIEYDE